MTEQPDFLLTSDGSHTIYSEVFSEPYHSRHGAIQESMHVFIEMGLKAISKKSIRIFEMGYGTGLNAFLTSIHAQENKLDIDYQAVEKYPLSQDKLKQLNYPEILAVSQTDFLQFHLTDSGIPTKINEHFELQLWKKDLFECDLPDSFFDLIYFDAFAPNAQEELWSKEVFSKLFKSMKEGGILTTYCAKGSVKRAMKAAGFELEGLPGPPGKREMTRCRK